MICITKILLKAVLNSNQSNYLAAISVSLEIKDYPFPTYNKCAADDFGNIKIVENIVATEEIDRFEQFLHLSQCFQKLSSAEASESVFMWERIKTTK